MQFHLKFEAFVILLCCCLSTGGRWAYEKLYLLLSSNITFIWDSVMFETLSGIMPREYANMNMLILGFSIRYMTAPWYHHSILYRV